MKSIFFCVLGLLFGCEQVTVKTDSELRFLKANKEQAALIYEANSVLELDLSGNTIDDLPALLYARELTLRAEEVFKVAKIVGIETREFKDLKARLASYESQVADIAIQLLLLSLDKTLVLKSKLETLPFEPIGYEAKVKSSNMASYLGEEYNESLIVCCFGHLHNINILLGHSEDKRYLNLRRLIVSVNRDLGDILKGSISVNDYRSKLESSLTL